MEKLTILKIGNRRPLIGTDISPRRTAYSHQFAGIKNPASGNGSRDGDGFSKLEIPSGQTYWYTVSTVRVTLCSTGAAVLSTLSVTMADDIDVFTEQVTAFYSLHCPAKVIFAAVVVVRFLLCRTFCSNKKLYQKLYCAASERTRNC